MDNATKMMTLTADRLRDLLDYDKATGEFRWRVVRRGRCAQGAIAGWIREDGHRQIMINGHRYYANRLAVLHVTGQWPVAQVEHRHGVRDDNRWSEIREASRSGNCQNQRAAQRHNKLGLLGVSQLGGKFQARIGVNHKRLRLGYFATAQAAHEAYLAAKRIHHSTCSI